MNELCAVCCMRLLDRSFHVRELPDISHKLRELGLIELMTSAVQGSYDGLRESPPVALEMLEGDLGVVSAVVQIERRHISKAIGKIGR